MRDTLYIEIFHLKQPTKVTNENHNLKRQVKKCQTVIEDLKENFREVKDKGVRKDMSLDIV